MANSLRDLSVAQLKKATAIKERIEELEQQLSSILGESAPVSKEAAAPAGRRRNKMSAAGRAAIAAAARARWAKINAAKGKADTAKPAKKRKMSAAGRAAIAAAQKARWAKVKAGK